MIALVLDWGTSGGSVVTNRSYFRSEDLQRSWRARRATRLDPLIAPPLRVAGGCAESSPFYMRSTEPSHAERTLIRARRPPRKGSGCGCNCSTMRARTVFLRCRGEPDEGARAILHRQRCVPLRIIWARRFAISGTDREPTMPSLAPSRRPTCPTPRPGRYTSPVSCRTG